jgi:hypothetical protein
MKTIFYSCTFALILFCSGCSNADDSNVIFHTDKKYLADEDYDDISSTLRLWNDQQKELPDLTDPKTAPIFNKIVDTNNIAVVAGDTSLGLIARNDFASKMFDHWKQLISVYSIMDQEDKYKYPAELIAVEKFGLHLQPYYITLANEKIIKDADDPKSPDILNSVNSNLQVLIDNYNLYLDLIKFEDRFNDDALSMYSDGVKEYFPPLITTIAPAGDYSEMSTRIDNMLLKSKNQQTIQQLQNIKTLITAQQASKKTTPAPTP